MLKIPTKHSTTLSLVLSVLFFIGCIAGAFLIPWYCSIMVHTHDHSLYNHAKQFLISDPSVRTALTIGLAYCALAVCILADALLFRLLFLVRQGLVFTDKSVALIRGVSWCCFLLGLVFCCMGFLFTIAFVLAFAAVFLGMCLRVVKNAMEEATQIKSENDLTV